MLTLMGKRRFNAALFINLLSEYPGHAGDELGGTSWPAVEARIAAHSMKATLDCYDLVVLLGKRVGAAFGFPKREYFESFERWVIVPHPSGVNRWWNDPKNVKKARKFLRSLDVK